MGRLLRPQMEYWKGLRRSEKRWSEFFCPQWRSNGAVSVRIRGGGCAGRKDVVLSRTISLKSLKASALKMCFAAYTKGTSALLCAILAAAKTLGVRDELHHQWSRNNSDFGEHASLEVRQVTTKAWRFAGEMEEISSTFKAAGVPGGFHAAAADIYRRIAHFKDATATPALEEVLTAITRRDRFKDST